ncbi:MAG: DNA polymerase II, partial [Lentisphaerae bacterium]|nr:DNA polymerase II [Lentisphaerota bacterium]
SDVHRLQLDIETYTTPGYDFPNASRVADEIIIVSLRGSTGWECCLSGPEMGEEKILSETVRLICERDPDVIEGHNLFNFDLPYIETRCKKLKVKFAIGRDGSTVKSRSSRFSAGERTSTYKRYDIYGRHIIDTYHLVQLHDVIHRDMQSYGLKAAARYFGVSAPERTYVEGSTISQVYREDPERLRAYAMDDVRETAGISEILSPSPFYQTQLIPISFQNCVTRGNATRIDSMLVAAYLSADVSIPSPQASRPFRGGLTGSLKAGIFENVWHVDVRSLYPSIIIAEGLQPRVDELGVYRRYLAKLREFRLMAKDAARAATGDEAGHYDALQGSFKVLINSFYGYAGFGQGTFNDYDLAEEVTAKGREILQMMLDSLEGDDATVIEMDTDGVYFVPPPGVVDTEVMQARVQSVLPDGIEVDLDTTYKAMLAYKAKNYVLLDHDDEVSITGAALKSRGLEPFQRRYIEELLTALIRGHDDVARGLAAEYAENIERHALPVTDFAKREVLSTAPRKYKEKLDAGKTRRSAAYELALVSDREYRQGDVVQFYVTGEKKSVAVSDAAKLLAEADPAVRDENIPYYLGKLKKLEKKFAEFLG